MPAYTSVPLAYDPYSGPSDVFAKSSKGFPLQFGKNSAASEPRQLHFNEQIGRLVEAVGPEMIPVFIEWQTGERNRMDRGCVGHAIACGLLDVAALGADGSVSHVRARL
jgi:hypothetical protein